MSNDELAAMKYADKERRMDDILGRLDRSEIPMDELASAAKEAAMLILSMQQTLTATKAEMANVFETLSVGDMNARIPQ